MAEARGLWAVKFPNGYFQKGRRGPAIEIQGILEEGCDICDESAKSAEKLYLVSLH